MLPFSQALRDKLILIVHLFKVTVLNLRVIMIQVSSQSRKGNAEFDVKN